MFKNKVDLIYLFIIDHDNMISKKPQRKSSLIWPINHHSLYLRLLFDYFH